MTTHTIEVLEDLDTILVTYLKPYNWAAHAPAHRAEMLDRLDSLSEPWYLVLDITEMSMSIGDLVQATNDAINADRSFVSHANVREMLIVTDSTLFKLAADGIRSASFGNRNVPLFATREEALAYLQG